MEPCITCHTPIGLQTVGNHYTCYLNSMRINFLVNTHHTVSEIDFNGCDIGMRKRIGIKRPLARSLYLYLADVDVLPRQSQCQGINASRPGRGTVENNPFIKAFALQ